MRKELAAALSALSAQGLKVDVKPLGWLGSIYVVYLPNGTQCQFLPRGLLKLKAEGRLSAAGIEGT